MPAFLNRVFRGGNANAKKSIGQTTIAERPTGPKYTDGWLRPEVAPEEVQELLRGCTIEMKARGLLSPFLLLPYRPHSDPCPARTFIRKFFSPVTGPLTGTHLQQELRLTEPDVLCSALKWCWSRLPGGVVTWDVYELFRQGEVDSIMARDSFATFIPIGAESEARTKIIFDYFDLLSAIAAHGKHNGLGGLKLSRLAGWWAFEHLDTGYGFEGGYATWTSAADACCHLFFAYLRSLSPSDPSRSVSLLPTSLRALLASVDYPPVTPPQFQTRTVRVIMTVDRVSPSPFALLRRAKNIQYGIGDRALKVFTDFDDPVRALTDECRRVLKCISSTGQSSASGFKLATGAQEQSWSRFQDIGFSGSPDSEDDDDDTLQSEAFARRRISSQSHSNPTPSTTPRDRDEFVEIVRPTTPSWADFMDAGFGDRELQHSRSAASHLLPPDKILPPIDTADRLKSSQSNRRLQVLEPGELESVKPMDVDDVFWWVWMSSLAGEETPPRKAVFGRCALVETTVQGAKWLVVEEKVRGAAILTESPVAIKEKKRWTPKRKLRRKSLGITEAPAQNTKPFSAPTHAASRTNIGPDQTAKIQAAAAALRQQKTDAEYGQPRRGGKPREHAPEARTNSVFTLQPVIVSEASPAMKWANRYDRDNMRDGYRQGHLAPEKKPVPIPEKKPVPAPERKPVAATERSLPALPREETVQSRPEPAPMAAPPVPAKASTVSLPAEPVRQHAPAAVANNGRSSPAFSKRMSMSPSPALSANPFPDKTGKKVSRLRAIFGMKADGPQPVVVGGGQLVVPSAEIGRQNSLRRKDPPIEVQPAQPVSPPPVEAVHHSPALEKETAPAYPSPPAPEHHPALAKQSFSGFGQGPLDDQPAFIPEEDSSDVSDLDPSDLPFRDEQPTPGPSASSASEPAVQDRWAQIRKNAAERAKASKMTDDVSATTTTTDARGSLDDGETSGEEMLEARLEQAAVLKKVVDAIKDLVQDCNFDCNDSGIALQAMDNSHVALVSMHLKTEGFTVYRCDRNVALGVNLVSLQKVLRAAQNEDLLTLKAEDAPDVLSMVFENSESDRISEYDIKLMDIDQEHLDIPATDYGAAVTLPSSEFQRICRDLSLLSESVAIEATKEGIKFSCSGDIGNGAVTLRQNTNVEKPELGTTIELQEPVALTFSLKYLVNFCKASGLSNTVTLSLSNEIPLLVEYKMAAGYVRFYLAPKIGDDE